MNLMILVQARMASTRLPGKVLMPVLGRPLLAYQLERLQRVKLASEMAVLTSDQQIDDAIEAFCESVQVNCFRGSETDVLDRYYQAAKQYDANAILRVTSDNPLIDPEILDRLITFYQDNAGRYDYVSTQPDSAHTFPVGLGAEIVSFKALQEAANQATKAHEREHVTPYIYQHPAEYRLGGIRNAEDLSRYRWTVDTPEDFQLIEKILTALYPVNPNFTMDDILALLAENPGWCEMNAHVEQRKV